jgi:hypothetical protein
VSSIIDHFTETELLSLNSDVGYSDAQSRALNSIQETFPISGEVTGRPVIGGALWGRIGGLVAGIVNSVVESLAGKGIGDQFMRRSGASPKSSRRRPQSPRRKV